jgi:hypothetical protein
MSSTWPLTLRLRLSWLFDVQRGALPGTVLPVVRAAAPLPRVALRSTMLHATCSCLRARGDASPCRATVHVQEEK